MTVATVLVGVSAVVTTAVLRFMRTGRLTAGEKIDKWERGFCIEPIGHGRGYFYLEPEGRLLEFPFGPRRALLVWSEESWPRQVLGWAQGRRAEILGRLRAHEQHAGFMEYGSAEERDLLHRMFREPDRENPVV